MWPESVRDNVLGGYVSAAAAHEQYGVTTDDGEIHWSRTRELREIVSSGQATHDRAGRELQFGTRDREARGTLLVRGGRDAERAP